MTKKPDSPVIVQDDIGFSNSPRRTLFFSVSEASEKTPEFNLVVNAIDWMYRAAQSSKTWENVPNEITFEHQDAAEYRTLVEIVIDRLLEMCEQDGIHSRTFWADAEDGEESVSVWLQLHRESPAKMLKITCTDETYLKEAVEVYAEQAAFDMTNILP